jgi:hypothetical protein
MTAPSKSLIASTSACAAVDVEMVRRLVEDEQVRALEGREPHQQPRLLAARQLVLTGVVGLRAGEAEAAPRGRGPSPPARRACARRTCS